ncbi:hypothetical protein DUNSADRAFT_5892, partial [Dunaliella salina]
HGLPFRPSPAAFPPLDRRPPPPSSAQLNPEEYPSLSATARADKAHPKHSSTRHEHPQDVRGWADDERAPPSLGLRSSDWPRADELPRFDRFGERLPPGRGFADYDAPLRPGMYDDDSPFLHPRGVPPPPPPRRPGSFGPSFTDGHGFEPYEQLFPPPPPPRHPPGTMQQGSRGSTRQQEQEDDDPERRAFKEELEKLAADLEKKKLDERSEAEAEKRTGAAADDKASGSKAGGAAEEEASREGDKVSTSATHTV